MERNWIYVVDAPGQRYAAGVHRGADLEGHVASRHGQGVILWAEAFRSRSVAQKCLRRWKLLGPEERARWINAETALPVRH